MATKAKRGTPATQSSASTTTAATPQVPTSTSSVQSPMTPTRMSRINEKNALANLNDRLAAYIERNQQLEHQVQVVTKQLSHHEENSTRSVTRIKTDYDKEIMGLRKLVDETAKDKSKLENESGTAKRNYEDMKTKHDKMAKELQATKNTLGKAENSMTELQMSLQRTTADRDKLAGEKKDFEGENALLSREVSDLKQIAEQERLGRIEAENQLRTKQDEISFKQQLHESELREIKTTSQIQIQEVDGRLHQEYEVKLQQSIQELRAEYEAQIRANKEENESLYEQKYSDLRNQLKRTQDSLKSKIEEINTLQMRLDVQSQSASKWDQEKAEFQRIIKDLQKKSEEDHVKFAKLLDSRDAEIDNLLKEKQALMNDYQDLMDTKVALDNEIATYRKLLECEEKRLSMSPPPRQRGLTPIGERRATPLRAVKKRRLEETYDAESEFQVDNKKQGDIDICDDDREGKFVKLRNVGEKDVSLSGWTLTRTSGDIDTTHKFHRQMKLEPKAIVTIWSADATGAVHEPPHNVTMKGQKWFPAEEYTSVLTNNSSEEMARRSTKRVQVSRQRSRFGYATPEDLFHQEADGAQADRCVIC